jgi:O-antigen/teichoic acid export membrane protein
LDAIPNNRVLSTDRGRGGLAIVDQLIVSAANFLTAALVGRFAGAEALGLFAIGCSVLVIFASAVRSLLLTPYAIFVHRSHPSRQVQMRGAAVLFCGSITAIATLLCLLVIAGLWRWPPAAPYRQTLVFATAVTLAAPAWMFRDLARHLCFADLQFERAIWIDAGQSAMQLAGLGLLVVVGELTAINALAALALTCLLSGLGWLTVARSGLVIHRPTLRWQWLRTWRFGRWGAMSQTSHAIQGYVLSWIIAFSCGLADAGLYAAAWSIAQLASPVVQGAGNALGPLLSKRFAAGGVAGLVEATRRFTLFGALVSAGYVLAIFLFGRIAVQLIYGDAEYDVSTLTLVLLAGSVAVSATALIATKVISVLEYPQINFAFNLAGLGMTTLFSALLGHAFQIEGAAVGLLLAAIIGAIAKWWFFASIVSR